jgi:hypothetical protein
MMANTTVELNMEKLYTHLICIKENLNGQWISKNSGYEKEACIDLGFDCECKRYWDADWGGFKIEIKKGKSIWLDEVRYSEIFMSSDAIENDECKQETITIFIIPTKDKSKIENIIIVDTRKLITFMKINAEWAKTLLSRQNETTRSLNCQQSMTIKDVKTLADYII